MTAMTTVRRPLCALVPAAAFAVSLLAGLAAAPAVAAGDIIAGEAAYKAGACLSCHGEGGVSTIPTNPVLAGQYESYLVQSLTGYREGRRQNPIMAPMAAALTDQQIRDIAAYLSSRKGPLQTAVGDL